MLLVNIGEMPVNSLANSRSRTLMASRRCWSFKEGQSRGWSGTWSLVPLRSGLKTGEVELRQTLSSGRLIRIT